MLYLTSGRMAFSVLYLIPLVVACNTCVGTVPINIIFCCRPAALSVHVPISVGVALGTCCYRDDILRSLVCRWAEYLMLRN